MSLLNPDITDDTVPQPGGLAALEVRLTALEALVGTTADDGADATLFGKIAAVKAVVDAL